MRIAYICADAGIPLYGAKGASNHVRELVCAFRRLGHDATVFASRLGKAETILDAKVSRIPEPAGDDPEVTALRRNLGLIRALAKAHAGSPFDLVYERYSLWSYAGIHFAKRRRLPFVLEVNSPLVLESAQYRTLHRKQIASSIEESLFGSASLIVAVSQEVSDYAASRTNCQGRILVLPNGVDLSRFVEMPPRRKDQPPTVGFLGSLKPWHGVDLLYSAFQRLRAHSPDARLVLVGDGPVRDWVEKRRHSDGLVNAVDLAGAVPKEQVPEALSRFDVAVAPYPPICGFYFSPLKVYEYMAAGCAIVASRIGQINTIINDGSTGLLVEPGDVDALTSAVQSLLSRPEDRRRLGANARAEAFARHGWDQRATELMEAIGRLPCPWGASAHAA